MLGKQPHTARKTDRNDYETDPILYGKLCDTFHFDCDVAASDDNHLCPTYFTEQNSALGQTWGLRNYCNPPFNMKEEFLGEAIENRNLYQHSVFMLPNNCRETDWWKNYALQADLIINLSPRVQFLIDGKRPQRFDKKKQKWVDSGAGFPCCCPVFYPRIEGVEYGVPKEVYWNWKEK